MNKYLIKKILKGNINFIIVEVFKLFFEGRMREFLEV